jgi:hypothetical protein
MYLNIFIVYLNIFECIHSIFDQVRSLPYEVQNHMRPNFTTPILYAKNHSKFYNFFCRATEPLDLYFVNF